MPRAIPSQSEIFVVIFILRNCFDLSLHGMAFQFAVFSLSCTRKWPSDKLYVSRLPIGANKKKRNLDCITEKKGWNNLNYLLKAAAAMASASRVIIFVVTVILLLTGTNDIERDRWRACVHLIMNVIWICNLSRISVTQVTLKALVLCCCLRSCSSAIVICRWKWHGFCRN